MSYLYWVEPRFKAGIRLGLTAAPSRAGSGTSFTPLFTSAFAPRIRTAATALHHTSAETLRRTSAANRSRLQQSQSRDCRQSTPLTPNEWPVFSDLPPRFIGRDQAMHAPAMTRCSDLQTSSASPPLKRPIRSVSRLASGLRYRRQRGHMEARLAMKRSSLSARLTSQHVATPWAYFRRRDCLRGSGGTIGLEKPARQLY